MTVEQYMTLIDNPKGALATTIIDQVHPLHQTAVLVYVKNFEEVQVERAIRLVTSLNNTDTIKADIYTVTEIGNVYAGLKMYDLNSPELKISKDQLIDEIKMNYNLIVEVKGPKYDQDTPDKD